jgi:Cysteine-rich secretory protein family
VTLTRGGFTEARPAASSPKKGRKWPQNPTYGAGMTAPPAGLLPRVALSVALVAAAVTLTLAGTADGGSRGWDTYLAPAGVCERAADASAPIAVQRRAVECLINWARNRSRRAALSRSQSLELAAELKGKKVVSCKQLSHTPCGSDATAPIQASGYPYAHFGENILVGVRGLVSPRDIVRAWLESPGHRANLLHRSFREVGAASVSGSGLLGLDAEVVWVAAFASRR